MLQNVCLDDDQEEIIFGQGKLYLSVPRFSSRPGKATSTRDVEKALVMSPSYSMPPIKW